MYVASPFGADPYLAFEKFRVHLTSDEGYVAGKYPNRPLCLRYMLIRFESFYEFFVCFEPSTSSRQVSTVSTLMLLGSEPSAKQLISIFSKSLGESRERAPLTSRLLSLPTFPVMFQKIVAKSESGTAGAINSVLFLSFFITVPKSNRNSESVLSFILYDSPASVSGGTMKYAAGN